MIAWFARNDIAANLLLVAILLGGIWTALNRVPLQVSPSKTYHTVLISMDYRGGTARDVEKSIVIPMEEAVADLSGIKRFWANASRGSAFLWVELEDSADQREMLDEIKARVDRIPSFPSETEKPVVRLPDSDSWHDILGLAVTGDLSESQLLRAAETVRDDLVAMDGISQARIEGSRPREVSIEIDQEKLRSYGLSFQEISDAIRRFSIDLPAGTIRSSSGTLTVRTLGQAYTAGDYSAIPIRAKDGSELQVGEVAVVTDGFEEGREIIRFNGQPGLMVRVMRHDLESAIGISKLVHEYVDTAHERFPAGMHLYPWDDESEAIKGRLGTLVTSLLQGCVLVFVVLALFLRPAVAFWVVIGIPVSFAGGVILMPTLGITANLMSIFGFIIVVGLVVDDAIVTAENIHERLKTGMDPLDAAIVGTKEVATPVTFGVLTTIAAFLPLLFFEGRWGTYARQIPFVVAPVLLFSLIESKLILPGHLKHLKTGQPRLNLFSRLRGAVADGLDRFIERVYRPCLDFALRHRYAVVACFVTMAVLMLGLVRGGRLEFITIPSVERSVIMSHLRIPGADLERTGKVVERITAAAEQLKSEFMDGDTGRSLIMNVYETVGSRGYHGRGALQTGSGKVMVEILNPSKRSVPGPTSTEVANRWQELVGEIPEAGHFSIRAESSGSSRDARMRETQPLAIEVRGPGSEQKAELAREVVELLRSYEGIKSASTEIGRGEDELEITLKPRAAELGLNQQILARQIRQAFYGEEAQRLQRGSDDLRVMVRLAEEERTSLHTLDTLRITAPSGASVSLDAVADVRMVKVPSRIERIDGSEVIEISAYPEDPDTDIIGISEAVSGEIQTILNKGSGLSFRYTGFVAESREANRRTLFSSLGLLFVLFALLAIPFKSVIQPIFVLLAVPFGIIGALLGHMIMGVTPSYLSIFGMLALAGVVVNDSLVLVDFINKRREEGLPLGEAITQAGARRFRPILLTSVTTFAGLMPLMFDKSIEGQFLIPMAVSLGWGILFATLITLFLIPCAYQISEDVGRVARRGRQWYLRPFRA